MPENSIIYHQHNNNRNHCCEKERFCIPDRHVSRKTVTSIIHPCANILKYCISKNISDQCANKCNQHRKCHIMHDKLSSGISGSPKRTDHTCFFSDRVADRNAKHKRHDHNYNIKQHDYHRLIAAHIISGKINRLILILRHKCFQRNNLSDVLHQILRNFLFLFLSLRFLIIFPGIIIL